MSHRATNWAIQQRGLKPAAKIVLWHLADCHNGHTGRCDPRQDTLAAECEMSRSTLNLHLQALESAGLIRRSQRINQTTRRQESTWYELAIDEPFSVSENKTRAVSENEGEPCPKNAESRVRNSDTNLGREPGKEPGTCESDLFGGSERQGKPVGRKSEIDQQLDKIWVAFPRRPNMPSKVKVRARLETALKKITFDRLMIAVHAYAADRDGQDARYTKSLDAWLNGEFWASWLEQAEAQHTSSTGFPVGSPEDLAARRARMSRGWRLGEGVAH